MTRTFAIIVLTHINIACLFIVHTSTFVFTVLIPTTLINAAIQVDHFTLTFFDECFVLAVVEVTVGVEEFAGGSTETKFERTFKDDAVCNHQFSISVDFIMFK